MSVNIYQEARRSPSPIASTGSKSFNIIRRTVHEVFPGITSAPGLVIAGTDSKHYVEISDISYRFAPILVGPEEVAGIHGTNERITIEGYIKMIKYYGRLIENAASAGGVI